MYATTSEGGKTSAYVAEFQIDTLNDILTLPIFPNCAIGSSCLCLEDSSVWRLGSDNVWHKL